MKPCGLMVGAAFVALLTGACDRSSAASEAPVRDLSMLNRMIELNGAHLGMEPFLRNRSRFAELAESAEGIANLAASELMRTWPDREEFTRDPEPWRRLRGELETAARDAAEAARAGDANGLHDAYSRMDGSCIACHKRYLETY